MKNINSLLSKVLPISLAEQKELLEITKNDILKEIGKVLEFDQVVTDELKHIFISELLNISTALQDIIQEITHNNLAWKSDTEKLHLLLEKSLQELKDTNNHIQIFHQREKDIHDKICNLECNLANNHAQLFGILNHIRELEEYRGALYYIKEEYGYYKDELHNGFIAIPNFKDRYKSLTKGLPPTSIETISLIINRLKTRYEMDYPVLNIFSFEEQQQIRTLRDHFYSNIICLDDDVFCYKNFLLPIMHFEPCVFYYQHSINKIKNIKSIESKDIIDAGGFIGDSALIFAPLTTRSVISFEPDPNNFANLLETIRLNQLKNVVAENLALSDKNERIKFSLNGTSSSIHPNNSFEYTDEIEVDAISLDDYVEKNNLVVGLIKTDLEGAEQEFLRGAINTIKKYKPILLISIYHSIDDFLDIKPMIESWDLGYHFEIVKPVDGSIMFETMLIAEVYE
ncbi:hypothetical protein BEQ56_10735 [Anaerolineaceae bacterium oral taxon 439]|nr:hypothetical protein BEQ56_10735 [Anaerolineaceae bacterium oral taxon 439]